MIYKERVKRSFSRAARKYDDVSGLPGDLAGNLLEKIDSSPRRILDIGTGTGRIAFGVRDKFPQAKIFGCDLAWGMVEVANGKRVSSDGVYLCQADAESLPYADKAFDLVISNAVYQWVEDLKSAFREISRILADGGSFAFTTFGKGTLNELGQAFKESGAGGGSHGQEFAAQESIKDILSENSFSNLTICSRGMKRYYADVSELILNIRRIGAKNATLERNAGLGSRKSFEKMKQFYNERFREDGKVFATFEIIEVFGRKGR